MAGFNDIWQVWFRGPAGDFVELGTPSSRNVIGSALTDVALSAGYYGGTPGVFRYEVTGKNGNELTLSVKTVLISDVNQPVTSPITVTGGSANSLIWTGLDITLSIAAQIGDIFEIGEGYNWDTTSNAWISQRAFGIIPQGEFGNIHTMKLKNIAVRDRAYVCVGWETNGPSVIQARQVGGVWKNMLESPIFLTGVDGIEGCLAADEEVQIEFRPQVPDAVSSEYNPLVINIWISSEAI